MRSTDDLMLTLLYATALAYTTATTVQLSSEMVQFDRPAPISYLYGMVRLFWATRSLNESKQLYDFWMRFQLGRFPSYTFLAAMATTAATT